VILAFSDTPIICSFLLDFFEFHKNFRNYAPLDFHPSYETGRTTQKGHTQTKVRSKWSRRIQACYILDASRQIMFHAFTAPANAPGIVHAVQLFNSHASYIAFLESHLCS
jgi:hypothetical protein